ncbi:hypothetical protein KSP39_PZI010572 [Platanthera zijinensis]|uniref:DEK-C domain-containing protein n=1 Tax=Platanthera zijinensis TaxID=2320716 RepID=A0AAP0G724_9ASPA
MVSDQALASCVESLLRQGGPAALTSVNGVVRQLEAKLGMDLSHKAAFIHDQIDILLGPRFPLLPPASAAGTHHFSQIPTAASQFTHLVRHQHDQPPCFTAQMSQAAAEAASTAAHQQHINRHEYLPPPVMTPAPTPPATLAPVLSPSPKGSLPAAAKR